MIYPLVEILRAADVWLFRLVNDSLKNPLFDVLMPFITDTKNFDEVFAALFLGLLVFGKARGRIAAVAIVAGALISDVISSKILKEIFARPRPFETLDGVCQLVGAAGYSMPSSHAFNSFAAATMFALFFKKSFPAEQNPAKKFLKERWVALAAYFCAFLSAYSRVYVGVHYPFDSLAGAVGGVLTGMLSYRAACGIASKVGRPIE